jgi:PleD family two-component response regulator
MEGLRLGMRASIIRITASFGVAGLKSGCDNLKDLLIAADRHYIELRHRAETPRCCIKYFIE